MAVLICLAGQSAWAVDFFVSKAGNDGNLGTEGSPWLTIQKAANSASAGSTVNIKAGTYNEKVNIGVSGSLAAGYTTFQNFGSDTVILDGTGLSVSGSTALVNIDSKSYIRVKGLQICNLKTTTINNVPIGIFVTGTAGNIELRNNYIHHIANTASISRGGNGRDAHGLAVYGTSGTTAISNIIIDGNEIANCTLGSSESMVVNGNVDTFEITNNVVHDNDNIGIDCIGFEGICPVSANDQARNGIVRGNTVYNITSASNPAYGVGDICADGIYVDGGKNIVIERNVVYKVDIGIEVASEHSGMTTTGVTVRNNLIYLCNYTGLAFGGYDTSVGWTEGCSFLNNTLIQNDTSNSWTGDILVQQSRNNVVKNNIVYTSSQNVAVTNPFGSASSSGNIFDYNLYLTPGGTSDSVWIWKNVEYYSFAAYKTASGQDAHSVFGDPLFANLATFDVHLQAGSPAIDVGDPARIIAAGEKDLYGNARMSGTKIDIGASESNGAAPTVYTVTFVEGANGTITGTKVQNVTQGGSATAVTAVPLTGYHFVNWSGSLTSTANPLTVSNVTANMTITANFAINSVNTYTVTFVEGANGTITGTKVQTVNQGGSTTEVTAVPSAGYHFVNWTGSLTSTANPLTVSNVTANKTITANFAINIYTVTFDLAGKGTRTGGGLLSQTVDHGAAATAPTVSANIGWTFTGWDKPLSNIIGNTTITAQYSAAPTFTVTFVEGANGTITGTKVQNVFQGGSTAAVTAAPSTGYHFVNWTGGLSSALNPLTATNVTADMAITANFAINAYTVTFDLAGYGTRTGGGALIQSVNHGSAATAPTVAANAGCTFTGWSRAFSNITENTRVMALYYFSICTVTFVEGANGTITGNKVQTVNNGASTSEVTAVPSSGYHFVNWSGSLYGTANPLIIQNVTTPMTITANFAMNDVQIVTDISALNVNEASTATFQVKLMSQPVINKTVSVSRTSGDSNISVPVGLSLNFTPENWNSYQTVAVTATHDADLTNGTATIACASTGSNNQTVTVTEMDDETTLTVTSGGNGTTSPSGAKTVIKSAATAITATANTGYHFVNWTVTSGAATFSNSSSASTTVAISEPATIRANFAINDVQISTNTSAINVNESSTATFQVKLTNQPAASKTVTVTKTDGDSSITVKSGASLTFTTANWNSYQTVTIAAAHDADTVNGTATITCASAGMTEQTVTVTEIDDDTALTVTNSGNGSTTPSGTVIVAKSAATAITASANTGYHFVNWTVTSGAATFGNASSASTTVAISDPATIQAAFAINTFALTASLVGEGFITPSETVNYGTGKTFTIYPYANYHLANVLVDGVSVGAVPSHTFLDVRASHTIKAVFAVNETGPIQMNMTSGFAVLAGTAINNTGNTVIDGDIGSSPGSAVTGFPPGTYTGANHVGDPTAVQAKFDLLNAYGAAAARTQGVLTISGGELGGRLLTPGLYKSGAGPFAITSADLTLDGAGDVNAVWIFQMPSSALTVGAGLRVVLLNGANACNIFWQVGASATIGTNAVFQGTVMADQSITLANGAALTGRALARNGQITLDNNTLTIPPAITITASAGSNGSITPSGIVEVHDGSQTFTITPEPGCHVVDVLVDGVSVGAVTSYAFTYVTVSHLISARFAVDADTTLTVVSDGNGTIAPSGAVVVTKSVATEILASANTGYHFVNWTLTSGVASIGNTDSAGTTIAITAPATVRANFAIYTYTVTFNLAGKGVWTGGGALSQTINHGAAASAPTVSGSDRLAFAGWDKAFNNITANITVTALYAPPLVDGVPKTGISGAAGSSKQYPVKVPAGQFLLEVKTYGGTGDCDLTVSGKVNGVQTVLYSSGPTNNETLLIENPEAGYYIISLNAKNDYAGLTLVAKYYNAKPLPPTALAATKGTYPAAILLSWKASVGAASYLIYRSETKVIPAVEISGTSDISFYDNAENLQTGKTYYYWVKSKNGAVSGTSGPSAMVSGSISNNPAAPATVAASDGAYFDKIRVTWAKTAGATSYLVYRSEAAMPVPKPNTDPIGETTALYHDDFSGDILVPRKIDGTVMRYYYWVAAKNQNGTGSISKPNDGYLSKKGPAKISASTTYSDRIVVIWAAVPGATAYDLYRYTDSRCTKNEFKVGDAVEALEYGDTVPAVNDYYYRAKAKYGRYYDSDFSPTAMGRIGLSDIAASTHLENGEISPDSGKMDKGSSLYFSVVIPMGTNRLVATLNGTPAPRGDNDCDLFAKFANLPTKTSYNAKGVENTASEILNVSNPSPGTWYFLLYGATAYENVTLTVNCYSVTDILLTQLPSNDMAAPFTATFKGMVVDETGDTGIPNIVLQVRNPITGLTSFLTKTDTNGHFTYSANINTEGEHTFSFLFTDIPDIAKGAASHTVWTRKGCLEPNNFFDFSSYLAATPAELSQGDTIGLQNFLNIRNGWEFGAINEPYEAMWLVKTIGATQTDANFSDKLDAGLYMFFYGVEGGRVGNDMTPTSAFSAVPYVVHVSSTPSTVSTPSTISTVLSNLKTLGIIDDTQESAILAGDVGVVTVASLSSASEGVDGDMNISLPGREQLEILAALAAGAADTENFEYSGVPAKKAMLTLGSGRKINVVMSAFLK